MKYFYKDVLEKKSNNEGYTIRNDLVRIPLYVAKILFINSTIILAFFNLISHGILFYLIIYLILL